MRKANVRAVVTNLLEALGLVFIVAGVYVAFGLAPAAIVAGVALIATSYLLIRGGRK